MKKILQVTMVLIIILGVLFSISNFTSRELKAGSLLGTWVECPDGSFRCMGDGTECAINLGFEPH